MEAGQWRLGNGGWAMEAGQWRLGNGGWAMEAGQWRLANAYTVLERFTGAVMDRTWTPVALSCN